MNVFLFTGQSAKHREMFVLLEQDWPEQFHAVKEEADAAIGGSWLPDPVADNPFPDNRAIQLAVFVANHMHMQILHAAGIRADYSAGLSLGEYNHLVHIGALDFADALKLVEARGRAYDAGPRGCMAAIFPTSEEELVPIVEDLKNRFEIAISNFNSPTQFVVAGESDGFTELIERIEADTWAEAKIIEKNVPMHCAYFRPAAEALRVALEGVPFRRSTLPYMPNVDPTPRVSATTDDYVEHLTRHVFEAVQFRKTVDYFLTELDDPTFIEVGPKHIITDLLHRRWCKQPKFSTHDRASFEAIVTSLT